MATPLIQSPLNLQDILMSVVGGQQSANETTSGTEKTSIDQNVAGTQTGTQTGTTTQNQTVQGSADIGGLQAILAKQMAGVTPEALTALFQQGAAQVPALTAAYANAAGARADNNSPLAGNILDLQSKLTQQAALMQQALMADAGKTAGMIADATRSQTTTGTTQNQQQQSGTTSQATTGTVGKETTSATSGEKTNSIDDSRLLALLGLGLGGSVLNQALPGGISGGVNSLTGGAANFLKSLFGGDTISDAALNEAGLGINLDQIWADLFNQETNGLLTGGDFTLPGVLPEDIGFSFDSAQSLGEDDNFWDWGPEVQW